MRNAEQVTFGGSGLDRAAELRGDPVEIARLSRLPDSRILPLWQGKPMVRDLEDGLSLAPVAHGHPILSHSENGLVLLGKSEQGAWFGVDVSAWEPGEQDTATVGAFTDPSEQHFPGLPPDHRFVELRAAMNRLDARDAELAATARAILTWHDSHRFCARCGVASDLVQAGWQRTCPACGSHHFPRTDPVVIMLITSGNSVLMGRSPVWPEGMYSLLAGFIEPGETMEAAVRREVFEESGIRVGEVSYLASQPWPFPASLMFGCRGTATTREITVDPVELQDAQWVSRERMLSIFAGDDPQMKPARKGAIAHFLIEAWLADRLD